MIEKLWLLSSFAKFSWVHPVVEILAVAAEWLSPRAYGP